MFLHTFHPSPILIDFGPFQIYWYGFLIALSVLIGFFIVRRLFRQYQLSTDLVYDLIFYLVIFSIIGARLWDIMYLPDYYLSNPVEILKIWQGGLAIHGVIVAGGLTLYIYSRIKKIHFWQLIDIFVPLLALGQAIGRWGNYFNQELYGLPTQLAWGIPIDLANRAAAYAQFEFFHPIFLYESLWCLLLFGLLIYFHRRRQAAVGESKLLTQPGFIFSVYLILYSLERFLIGFLRLDPMPIWVNLRLDQWISLTLIVLGLAGLFMIRRLRRV